LPESRPFDCRKAFPGKDFFMQQRRSRCGG
jgi:hypothetical protein